MRALLSASACWEDDIVPVRDGSEVSRRDVQSLRRNPQQPAEVPYAACERDRPPAPDVEVEDDNVKEEDAIS